MILDDLQVDTEAAFDCAKQIYVQLEMLNLLLRYRVELETWISEAQVKRFADAVIFNVTAEKGCLDDLIKNYPAYMTPQPKSRKQ
jgi:hypothetical protein